MLYDVYKVSPGIYRYVGPYEPDDERSDVIRERHDGYIWTVRDIAEAKRAAMDDHADSGARGGLVTRMLTIEQAETQL